MIKQTEKRKQNLIKVFQMIKKRENIVITDKPTHFSDTEIRLMSELFVAKYENRQLISSELARLLGVTRSAVSQIVQKLEKEGMIVRLPSPTDKKIAFVELTNAAIKTYQKDVDVCAQFVGTLVEEFGEERFDKMYELFVEFADLAKKKING